jgi:hypothetical protein
MRRCPRGSSRRTRGVLEENQSLADRVDVIDGQSPMLCPWMAISPHQAVASR